MPRPRTLSPDGLRRTITLSKALDDELVVKAAGRRITVSALIEEMLLRHLNQGIGMSSSSNPLVFPEKWDGTDLRERLIALRLRQKDLAGLLQVHKNTLNSWVTGTVPWIPVMLKHVQKVLIEWNPDTQRSFRVGSRSPWPKKD